MLFFGVVQVVGVKASVIIPAFNAEKTIAKCLESVVSQKPGFHFEAVVVDDGSKDKTFEVTKGFGKVRVLRQRNAGPAVARNNGARKAKGECLVFLDSDCVADSNWLREMVKPFKNRQIAGVQGIYWNAQSELIARFVHLEIEHRYEKMARQQFIDFVGTYSAAYRKRVFLEAKGFDTGFPMASGEDTDLSFRINEAGHKMAFNQKAFVHHSHPISLAKYLKTKFFRAFWRTKIYQKHRKKIAKDSYTSQMVKVQLAMFYLIVLSLAAIPLGFNGMPYAFGLLGVLLLSTLPFAFWAGKQDLVAGIIAPTLILARTTAFGCGLALGVANSVRRKL